MTDDALGPEEYGCEAPDGAVKVPKTPNDMFVADLLALARAAGDIIHELEEGVLQRDALVLERDTEIDRLLVEAVVLREKQERHDKVLAEKENQIAWDKHEIRRLTDMTRKWWQK